MTIIDCRIIDPDDTSLRKRRSHDHLHDLVSGAVRQGRKNSREVSGEHGEEEDEDRWMDRVLSGLSRT